MKTRMADAPATTWLLVTANPDGSMMNPEPLNPLSIGLSSEGNWKEPDTSMRITAFCASAMEPTMPSGNELSGSSAPVPSGS